MRGGGKCRWHVYISLFLTVTINNIDVVVVRRQRYLELDSLKFKLKLNLNLPSVQLCYQSTDKNGVLSSCYFVPIRPTIDASCMEGARRYIP